MANITNAGNCYVYWLRGRDFSDVSTQGYVGISQDIPIRVVQHRSSAAGGLGERYHPEFALALLIGDFIVEEIFFGSREECLSMERCLRPEQNIGWNLAVGGGGGYSTHGYTGTPTHSAYYRIKGLARAQGVYFQWGDLESFGKFYHSLEGEGELTREDLSKGYCEDNVKRECRKTILRRHTHKHIFNGKGYSVIELSEEFGVKPNTITHRLRRGYSVGEAVGVDLRVVERQQPVGICELAKSFVVRCESSNKIVRDHGYNSSSRRLIKIKGFPDYLHSMFPLYDESTNEYLLVKRSKRPMTVKDMEQVLSLWREGKTINRIKSFLGFNYNTVKALVGQFEDCKKISRREYLKIKEGIKDASETG